MNSRKIGGGFTFCWGWVGGRLGVGRIITAVIIQCYVTMTVPALFAVCVCVCVCACV